MASSIVIEGKEHSCSKRVEEEFNFVLSQLEIAKNLAKRLEIKQDELMADVQKNNTEIQKFIRIIQDL
jgi:hypothetical protein